MKKIFQFLVTSAAGIILSACAGPAGGDGLFRWTHTGTAADSTVTQLEWAFINNRPTETIETLTGRLDSIAKSDSDRITGSRAWFWKGRLLMRLSRFDEARWHLQKAMEMVDSTAYPYDAQRISHLLALMPSTSASEKYIRLKNAEKYYQKTKDDFMLAHIAGDLGIMSEGLGGLRNPHEILQYYQTADSLYERIGFHEYQTKNLINVAQGHIHTGDSVKCREIITSLLNHPLAVNDSSYYDLVLLSAGGWFGDVDLLKQLYTRTRTRNQRMGIEAALLLYDRYADTPDSAAEYIDYAYRNIDNAFNEGSRAAILERYGARLGHGGQPDSAYLILKDAMEMQRDFTERNNLLDVARIGKVYEIERIEAAHSATLKRRSQWFWITLTIVISLVSVVASRLMIAKQKERLRSVLYQQEAERKQRRLTATSLVMEEKDKVLQTLIGDIHRLGREGKLTSAEVRMLEQNFRVHMSGKSEWDGFVNSFEEINPGFFAEFKDKYPSVSEGDLRLAAYIKMGMGQKQIARMMGVQPESVKKNRHRLRARMGLGEQDSLEDILRSIGNP